MYGHRDETESSESEGNGHALGNLGVVTIGIAVCSLIISGLSAFYSYAPRVDTVRTRAIEDLYESFEEWNALALGNPHISHLLAHPDRYGKVSGLVENSAGRLDDGALNRLVLAELVMADMLIAAYEEMLTDLDRAEAFGDALVLEATMASLVYFESRVMHNPRLLHLWHELASNRSRKLHNRFTEVIEPGLSEKHPIDHTGPIERARMQGH